MIFQMVTFHMVTVWNFHTNNQSPSEYISYRINFEIISDHLSVTVWNAFIRWHFRWWRSARFYHPPFRSVFGQLWHWKVVHFWSLMILSHFHYRLKEEMKIYPIKYLWPDLACPVKEPSNDNSAVHQSELVVHKSTLLFRHYPHLSFMQPWHLIKHLDKKMISMHWNRHNLFSIKAVNKM